MTDTQTTCGKGLAANAVLPSKIAELLEAQATVLERHKQSIDQTDPNAAPELEAYTRLAANYYSAANQLADLATQMAAYRDLPMPRHDPSVMTAPGGQMDAFRAFMSVESELQALLEQKLKSEAAFLA